MEKWFLFENEKVSGPLSTAEVQSRLSNGQASAQCLIWGQPMHSWRPLNSWTAELPKLEEQYKKLHTPPAAPAPSQRVVETSSEAKVNFEEKTSVTATAVKTGTSPQAGNEPLWHYALDGSSKGPLSRADLVRELKPLRNKDEVLVWTNGMKTWTDLYDIGELAQEVGIDRRQNPRAAIRGSVVVRSDGQTLVGQLKTISVGGIRSGNLDIQLAIGQVVDIEIKSEQLAIPIIAKATVQYMTDLGHYGFQFQTINQEAQSCITEFMLKKQEAASNAA
jgi:hypothetical protein